MFTRQLKALSTNPVCRKKQASQGLCTSQATRPRVCAVGKKSIYLAVFFFAELCQKRSIIEPSKCLIVTYTLRGQYGSIFRK